MKQTLCFECTQSCSSSRIQVREFLSRPSDLPPPPPPRVVYRCNFFVCKIFIFIQKFFPRDFPLFLPKAWAVVVVVVVVVMVVVVVVVVVLNKGREISGKGVYITYTHKVYSLPSRYHIPLPWDCASPSEENFLLSNFWHLSLYLFYTAAYYCIRTISCRKSLSSYCYSL